MKTLGKLLLAAVLAAVMGVPAQSLGSDDMGFWTPSGPPSVAIQPVSDRDDDFKRFDDDDFVIKRFDDDDDDAFIIRRFDDDDDDFVIKRFDDDDDDDEDEDDD